MSRREENGCAACVYMYRCALVARNQLSLRSDSRSTFFRRKSLNSGRVIPC